MHHSMHENNDSDSKYGILHVWVNLWPMKIEMEIFIWKFIQIQNEMHSEMEFCKNNNNIYKYFANEWNSV